MPVVAPEGGRCYRFGAVVVCDGDLVAVTLTRGETIIGIVRGFEYGRHYGFLALTEATPETADALCREPPTTGVSLRRISVIRVLKRGVCNGEG